MENCVFCKIISGEFSSYKIFEDDVVMVFLSIDPISYGHTLIVPKSHFIDYTDLPLDILTHINKVGKDIFNRLMNNLNPDGIKLIQNNGCVQEVKHYHLHLLPIFEGDEPGDKKDFDKVLKNIMR